MNRYSLEVRGQTVRLTFTRINDSRRLEHYYGHKNPNLFGVRAAMLCHAEIPAVFAPKWQATESGKAGRSLPLGGVGFCSRKDQWKSQTGRHRALNEALKDDLWIEASLRDEIVAAFTAEEARRTKVKGPSRQQKTSGPKPRRPGLRKMLAQLQETLERFADIQGLPWGPSVEKGLQELWRGSCHYIDGDPHNNSPENLLVVDIGTNIRPADTSEIKRGCTPTCNANLIPGAAHNCGIDNKENA
jgi:hypothetical protein